MSRRTIGTAGAAIVTLAMLIAAGLPVRADHSDLVDPNDVAGPLDLSGVTFDHSSAPRWRLLSFSRWTIRGIWDRGYLIVQLDTRGDERVDLVALVRSDGRELVGDLFRLRRSGREVRVGRLRVEKRGPRAAWVSVPLVKLSLGPNRTSYFWSVLSSFTGRGCSRTCLDAVPDEGLVEQPLPGATPTPTPTPTPAPTPTPTPTPTASPSPEGG